MENIFGKNLVLFAIFILYPFNDLMESVAGVGLSPFILLLASFSLIFYKINLDPSKSLLLGTLSLNTLLSINFLISIRYLASLIPNITILFFDFSRKRKLIILLWYYSFFIHVGTFILNYAIFNFEDWTGLFLSRNNFVFFSVFLFSVRVILFPKSKKNDYFLLILILITLISRGRSGFFLMLIWYLKDRISFKVVLGLASIVIIIILSLTNEFKDFIIYRFIDSPINEFNGNYGSVGIRLQLYSLCIELGVDNLFSGIGMGNFQEVSDKLIYNPVHSVNKIQPHSSWLGMIAELGFIPALFLFFLFLRESILKRNIISFLLIFLFMFGFDGFNRPLFWFILNGSFSHNKV